MRRAAATTLLGAALVCCGILFALPSLLVPGIALAALAIVAAGWVVAGSRHGRVSLTPAASQVQEGEPLAIRLSARVARLSPPAEVTARSLSLTTDPRRAGHRTIARFGRRGRRELGPVRLTVRDPLGLASRDAAEASASVLVVPRIEPVRPGRRAGAEGSSRRAGSGSGPELEFDALRAHRPGAPATRIHWPTVARTGELMERRLRPESDSRPLVVLDPRAPPSEEALDRAVRAAASLCRALAAAGGCRMLLPGDRRATSVEQDLRAWPALHGRLALVEAGGTPPRLPRSASPSLLLWVTAAGGAPPGVLERSPSRARYLVRPGPPPACGAAFTVAGCAGVVIDRPRVRAA